MKNKKAILVWSDGIETNYTEYTSTPDKTAVEQAQDQMHREYQEHGEANEECGAFEGDMECYFAAEDQDSCRWTIIPVSEDETESFENDVRIVATDIKWDTDGDQEILDLLPKRVILPEEFCIDDYLDTERLLDDVLDWLSAEYEYSHFGFRLDYGTNCKPEAVSCKEVTLCLEDLFDHLVNHPAINKGDDHVRLTYGGVLQIKTNGDQRCYALKTKTGISCIDGDVCKIIEEKEDYILLQEIYTQLPFKLSRKEYMIASVPAIPLTKKERTRHLAMLFADAITNGYDELDVYSSMLERGMDVDYVRKYAGTKMAEHMQKYCEEHGLL